MTLRYTLAGMAVAVIGSVTIAAEPAGSATEPLIGLPVAGTEHALGFSAYDGAGRLYFSTYPNCTINRLELDGAVTTVAGTGVCGLGGSGGSALTTPLNVPMALDVDTAGRIFLLESMCRLRMVDTTGIITTLSGDGSSPPAYGLAASEAKFCTVASGGDYDQIQGLQADEAGGVFLAVDHYDRLFHIGPSGVLAAASDSYGPPDAGQLARDSLGNLYLASGARIVRIAVDGSATRVAGTGTLGYSGDGGLATSARVWADGIDVDAAGHVYFGNTVIGSSSRIRRVDASTGIITTIAGGGTGACDGRAAHSINTGVAPPTVTPDGSLLVGGFPRCRLAPNRPPTVSADSLTVGEDDPDGEAVDVALNDSDADGHHLTFAVLAQGASGSATCTTEGVCTYVPNPDVSGADSFTYTATDSVGSVSTGTVAITITPDADPTPSITIGDATAVFEGADGASTDLRFTLSLDRPAAGGESVRVRSTGGTATPNTDHAMVDEVITFGPGVTTSQVHVEVFGDGLIESDETARIELTEAVGLSVADGEGSGLILNDDLPARSCVLGTTVTVTWPGVTLGRTPSPVSVRSASAAASVGAGTWRVTLTSSDPTHSPGVHTDQTREQWRVQLMSGPTSVAWSAAIGDLPTDRNVKTQRVGTVTVPAGVLIDQVRAVHLLAAKPTAQWGSTHSIQPTSALLTCVG